MRRLERLLAAGVLGWSPWLAPLGAQADIRCPGGCTPRVTTPVLTVVAEEGHQSSVRFSAPGDPGDRYTRVIAGVRQRWQRARTAVDVALGGDVTRYAALHDLDHVNYDAAVRAARRLGPRTTLSADAEARSVFSSDGGDATLPGVAAGPVSPVAGGAQPRDPSRGGLLLPRTVAHLSNVRSVIERRLTPRTTGSATLEHSRASFDSPFLVPGSSTAARASLLERVSLTEAVLVRADLVRGLMNGRRQDADALALGWEEARERLQGSVVAGATRSRAGDRQLLHPTGTAEVHALVGEGRATVRYARDVTPAFGLGVLLIADHVGASYTYTGVWGADIEGYATRAWHRDVSGVGGRLVTTESAVEARRVLPTGLLLGTAVSYRRRESGDVPSLEGFGTRIFIGAVTGLR